MSMEIIGLEKYLKMNFVEFLVMIMIELVNLDFRDFKVAIDIDKILSLETIENSTLVASGAAWVSPLMRLIPPKRPRTV